MYQSNQYSHLAKPIGQKFVSSLFSGFLAFPAYLFIDKQAGGGQTAELGLSFITNLI